MTSNSTTPCLPQSETEAAVHRFDSWFDPIEAGLRDRVRDFLHAMFEGELDVLLSRPRYGRRGLNGSNGSGESAGASGHRHGHRSRSLMGSFGRVEIAVPRARLNTPDGKTTEWKSKVLRADREHLSRRHQHASRAPCARYPVWRRGWQGHGELGVAQGEE